MAQRPVSPQTKVLPTLANNPGKTEIKLPSQYATPPEN